jgi:hypothetical protein
MIFMSIIHFGKGNTGNAIIQPVTPDKLNDGSSACGFDQHRQLWVRWHDRDDPTCISSTIVADVRTSICPVCQKGWDNTAASIRNQEFVNGMDRHAHRTCMNGYGHLRNFFFWHDLVCQTPMNQGGLEFVEIPNEYGSTWTGPWYRVTYRHLPDNSFILGARKRVYNVEVMNVSKELVDVFAKAFDSEKTTQESTVREDKPGWLIHAWTREKAQEYLQKIVGLLVAWKKETEPEPVLPAQT